MDIAVDLVSLQAKDLLRRVVGRRQSSPPGGRASPEPGQRPRAPRSTTSSRSRAPNRSPRPAGGCRARPRCSSRRWQTARAPLLMSVAPWFSWVTGFRLVLHFSICAVSARPQQRSFPRARGRYGLSGTTYGATEKPIAESLAKGSPTEPICDTEIQWQLNHVSDQDVNSLIPEAEDLTFGDQHARCKQPQPSNGRAQRLEDGKEFCWSLKAETSTQTNIIQSTCRTSKQRKSPFNTWVFHYPRL